jgi:hypothetical protein
MRTPDHTTRNVVVPHRGVEDAVVAHLCGQAVGVLSDVALTMLTRLTRVLPVARKRRRTTPPPPPTTVRGATKTATATTAAMAMAK